MSPRGLRQKGFMRTSRHVLKNQFESTSRALTIFVLVAWLLMTILPQKSWGTEAAESLAPATVENIEKPTIIASPDEKLLKFKSGFEYSIKRHAQHPEDAEAYNGIPAEEQLQFHNTRFFILKSIAAVLNFSRFASGSALLIGEKIYHTLKSRPSTVAYLDGYMATDERLPLDSEVDQMTDSSPPVMSIKERGFAFARKILDAIDRQLWRQAPLVGRSDEFGLLVSVGAQAEVAKGSKGFGGSWSLGISLGYNRSQNAVVFEIYREKESVHKALPAVSVAAVLGKIGGFIQQSEAARPESEERIKESKGQAIYPPGFPAFMEATPTFFGSGMSSALGVPPPPISDAFAYINNLNRKTLVKISVSPLLKGFVRMRSDLDLKLIKKAARAERSVAHSNTRSISSINSCQAFFAR